MGDEQVSLFDAVQRRIAEATAKVEALDISDDVRRMANRHLSRLDRASRTDLSHASRQVEEYHAALDAGQVPIYD